MPSPSDEPVAKCWINLYAKDKAWLYRRYGHGWSEIVRKLVREHRREQEVERVPINLTEGEADGE